MTISKKAANEKFQAAETAIRSRRYSDALKLIAEGKSIVSGLREPAVEPLPEPPSPETPVPASAIFVANELEPKLSLQQKASGRAKIVPTPAGLTGTAIAFECRTGDSLSSAEANANPPTSRCEAFIDPDNYPAVTKQDTPLFYRYSLYFPTDYDVKTQGFRTLGQWRHDDESGIVVGFYGYMEGSKLYLHWDGVNGPICAPITPGATIDVLLEAVWSTDALKALQRGFVNGKEVGVKHQLTKGCYAKFGNYKQASIPTCTVIYSNYVVGESKTAVGL